MIVCQLSFSNSSSFFLIGFGEVDRDGAKRLLRYPLTCPPSAGESNVLEALKSSSRSIDDYEALVRYGTLGGLGDVDHGWQRQGCLFFHT